MAEVEVDSEFSKVQSNVSETFPIQCSGLRKTGYVVLKGKPCRIVDMITSKTGRHGHPKVHLIAVDIFTGKKCEDVCPASHSMQVPNVTRREFEVIDLSEDGFLSLMSEDGDMRHDLKITENCVPSAVGAIRDLMESTESSEDERVVATVWKAMGEEVVKEIKLGKVI